MAREQTEADIVREYLEGLVPEDRSAFLHGIYLNSSTALPDNHENMSPSELIEQMRINDLIKAAAEAAQADLLIDNAAETDATLAQFSEGFFDKVNGLADDIKSAVDGVFGGLEVVDVSHDGQTKAIVVTSDGLDAEERKKDNGPEFLV